LESPFGAEDNDLPMMQMQVDWNKSVATLLARRANQPPLFDFDPDLHRNLDVSMSDGSPAQEDKEDEAYRQQTVGNMLRGSDSSKRVAQFSRNISLASSLPGPGIFRGASAERFPEGMNLRIESDSEEDIGAKADPGLGSGEKSPDAPRVSGSTAPGASASQTSTSSAETEGSKRQASPSSQAEPEVEGAQAEPLQAAPDISSSGIGIQRTASGEGVVIRPLQRRQQAVQRGRLAAAAGQDGSAPSSQDRPQEIGSGGPGPTCAEPSHPSSSSTAPALESAQKSEPVPGGGPQNSARYSL